MLEHTFHTPLPATLEVSILSGDIEVETGGGEETTLTIDGDERLLEDVEVRHDGGRVVVKLRGRKRVGFELSLGSLIFGSQHASECGSDSEFGEVVGGGEAYMDRLRRTAGRHFAENCLIVL